MAFKKIIEDWLFIWREPTARAIIIGVFMAVCIVSYLQIFKGWRYLTDCVPSQRYYYFRLKEQIDRIEGNHIIAAGCSTPLQWLVKRDMAHYDFGPDGPADEYAQMIARTSKHPQERERYKAMHGHLSYFQYLKKTGGKYLLIHPKRNIKAFKANTLMYNHIKTNYKLIGLDDDFLIYDLREE